jgi:hypothetical protein
MRILEIGECRYISKYAPAISDFFTMAKTASPRERLTFRQILVLRKRLKAAHYDLVVYHITAKVLAPWHRDRAIWRIIVDVILSSFLRFHKIGWHWFHWFLAGGLTPLVVIDTQDVPRMTKSESVWLDRCRFWFMRELPPNHMNLFLNMNSRCGDVTNIQRQKALSRNFAKLEPFSLGFDPARTPAIRKMEPSDKIYDVFYAGANHTTTVRQRGIEELRSIQASGLRVYIPEDRLSRDDFFKACSLSWLVWSPEGQGWDCYRHYEALLLHSVPLINFPTIERLCPLRHGEHCLYYRPETGGLSDAIESALKDHDRLSKIAEQGCAYVLQYHARSQLARHVLRKVGLLEQAEPHLSDG